MWHQPCQRCKYTTSVDIQKRAIKKKSKLFTHVESHASAVSLLNSGEQRYIKAISMLTYYCFLSFRLLLQQVSLFFGLDQNNAKTEERKKLTANVLKQDQNTKHAQIFFVNSLSQATSRHIIYTEAMRLSEYSNSNNYWNKKSI